jgi:hypothetical protein
MRLGWGAAAICALAAGCGSSGGGAAAAAGGSGPGVAQPSLSKDGFVFYGAGHGMARDVWDVSPDEAGNVWVAGGDVLLVKRRDEARFRRLDPASAGITRNCDAAGQTACPIVSVGGGAPGVAVVGLKGLGTDGDDDPDWWLDSGGADVLAFDGERVTRTRHVHVAGPPERFCMNHDPPPCSIGDATYEKGRRKVRQVLRVAVNHRAGTLQYGDVWMAGTHGSFNLLVANPEQRGWVDLTDRYPGTEDRRYVWEHDHPAMTAWANIGGVKQNAFLAGTTVALAIDPTTGDPWAANETRLASKQGAGTRWDGWDAPMWPPWKVDPRTGHELDSFLDVWPDPRPADPFDFDAVDPRWMDAVASLSFCDDGTLWIASSLHGLARRSPGGAISYLSLPDGLGDSATAVACDPSDGSVWVGFGWGGFGRWSGSWWTVEQAAPPEFALNGPVRSIQIDRWASPRIVYLAHAASRLGPGGLTVYQGP